MTERLLRTFIAVSVPRQVLNVRDMLKTTVIDNKARIRWVKDGQIHLTLKFLGHTPAGSIDRINGIIEKVITSYKSMEYQISNTGCFPVPERPRVLWLGIEGNITPLQALVKDLDRQLSKIGFPAEERDYHPHITIARVKYPPKRTPDVSNFINTSYNPIQFNVARIQYMSSELFPNGPVYSILGTHFLASND